MKNSKSKKTKSVKSISRIKHTFDDGTLKRQMLSDLEKRISLNVGNFLVLTEEGDPTQIAMAHQKAKSDFMKFGPEMHRLAKDMGGDFLVVVADYLESIDIVLHSNGILDDDKISNCFHTTQKLESELKR